MKKLLIASLLLATVYLHQICAQSTVSAKQGSTFTVTLNIKLTAPELAKLNSDIQAKTTSQADIPITVDLTESVPGIINQGWQASLGQTKIGSDVINVIYTFNAGVPGTANLSFARTLAAVKTGVTRSKEIHRTAVTVTPA